MRLSIAQASLALHSAFIIFASTKLRLSEGTTKFICVFPNKSRLRTMKVGANSTYHKINCGFSRFIK